MSIQLIKAKKEDLIEIAKIYAEEFSKPPYNEPWTKEKSEKKIKYFFENYDLYSIIFENNLIGFITVNPNFMCPGEVAFGEEIAIRKESQNKGIGTFVFKQIFEIYKKRGYKKFMGIAATDGKAIRLYSRLGLLESKKAVIVERGLK